VDDNIKAIEIYKKITPEIAERIEKIMNNRPEYGLDWKKWAPKTPRR